jgi:hypothetical protein
MNLDKRECLLLPRGRSNDATKLENRSFENVAQFKYLGTTVIDRNLIQEEIKRRLLSAVENW